MRHRRYWAIGLVGALAFATPSVAAAKDYCLKFSSVNATLVGKNFSIPVKGRCKPFSGFLLGEFTSAVLFSGNACTSSDGITAHFNLHSANSLGLEGLDLSLDVATGSATGQECTADTGSGGSCGSVTATTVDCSPNPLPFP